MKLTVKTQRRVRRTNNHNQIGAHVPTHIFALAQAQARADGKSLSAWVGALIVKQLQKDGTTLSA